MYIETIINHLHSWQSLTAGALAFIGAIVTTWVLILNLKHEKKKYKNAEQQTAMYNKSLLADALTELVEYTELCYLHVTRQDPLPEKPHSSIAVLRENIRSADIDTAKNIAKINSFYQVHNSRLRSYASSSARNKLERMLYDICKLHIYFARLFDYAREETDKVDNIDPDFNALDHALRNVMGRRDTLDLEEEYERYRELIRTQQ